MNPIQTIYNYSYNIYYSDLGWFTNNKDTLKDSIASFDEKVS